ncbi:MAG TPA: cation-transporting P-type ATPase, partial [Thermoleophilia bacterium]|nr:cation-transporting P-type ATPase [Thermoleophilia bacterium]
MASVSRVAARRARRSDHVDDPTGLSPAEAGERLRSEGYNELPSSEGRGVSAIAVGVIKEPMFLLLVFSGALYATLGDIQEAAMLLGFVFVVMGITVYQERKTERALDALRDLSSPRACVVRGGRQLRIPGREVVRGDIVMVSEGDRVPADAAVLSCNDLQVDESLLTGESVPVRKLPAEGPFDSETILVRPGGDDLPNIYSGTLVVQGQGIAEVGATGTRTEMGRIGLALEQTDREPTDLQRQSGRLVRNMALVGVFVCCLVVLMYGWTRGDWIDGLLAGVTLAMATLPEEIPVVLTVFLALGAWRISQKNVLTRRIPAVESLGSATVLCVDKTGTLTVNRMTIARLFAAGRFFVVPEERAGAAHAEAAAAETGGMEHHAAAAGRHVAAGDVGDAAAGGGPDAVAVAAIPAAASPGIAAATAPGVPSGSGAAGPPLGAPVHEAFHRLVEYGILASELDPFDPMEKAFDELGGRYFAASEHLHRDWELVHEYSLSRDLLAMSHVWRSPTRDACVVAAKGAPHVRHRE